MIKKKIMYNCLFGSRKDKCYIEVSSLWIVYNKHNEQVHINCLSKHCHASAVTENGFIFKRKTVHIQILFKYCHLFGMARRQDKKGVKNPVTLTFFLCNRLLILPLIFKTKFISGPHTPGDISLILL